MKFRKIVLCTLSVTLCSALFVINSAAQSAVTGGPLPPPVEITFITQNAPAVGEDIQLILQVTALEDMHADIRCLLPEGVEGVMQPELMVMPVMGGGAPLFLPPDADMSTLPQYTEEIILFTGPLVAGEIKEFTFSVKAHESGHYELAARVQAMAKWGSIDEPLILDIP